MDRADYDDSDFTAPARKDEPPETVFVTLGEALRNPLILQPPEMLIPRLAYRKRATIVAGPDKCGKTTITAQGCAAKTRGSRFLGEQCTPGSVLWVGCEEAFEDGVRRLHSLEADPDRTHILVFPPDDLLEVMREYLANTDIDVVLIDSLTEYARLVSLNEPPAEGDSSAWSSIVRPLIEVARDFDVGLVILHHVRRSDGQYRGSTEVAAAVDCLWEMARGNTNESPTLRRFKGRARWAVQEFTVDFHDGMYELSDGQRLSVDALVLLHIEANPGCSKQSLRDSIGVRATKVDDALSRLLARGAIQDRGGRGGSRFYAPGQDLL